MEYVQNHCFKQDHILYNYCSLRDAISKYEHHQSNPCHDVAFENDMKSMSSFMDFFKAQQRGNFEENLLATEILILINVTIIFFCQKYPQDMLNHRQDSQPYFIFWNRPSIKT